MQAKLLRPGDMTTLTLAADARVCHTDYYDDQIWELSIGRGEPPAINFQTTYGLRARGIRIFPSFGESDQRVSDPDSFASPIKLEYQYPNALELIFAPLYEISARIIYWIPQSHAAAGRITLTNFDNIKRHLHLEWIVSLNPGPMGERISIEEIDTVNVLQGSTQNLHPVFFITGGMSPGIGSFPSLAMDFDLSPGENKSFSWAIAALENMKLSFDLARRLTTSNWQAELTRLRLLDQGLLEIFTGDEFWDQALKQSQIIANSLLLNPTDNLPHTSFVLTRQPDHGYSIKGDGSDYSYLWNGQTVLDAYYLSELLLPMYPEIIAEILRNFFAIQEENGSIDWKPGLGGQRSHLNATPLLASLVWKVYQYTNDRRFLEETFEPLIRFFSSWIISQQDRDNDGIPEWAQFYQTGLDEHPIFSHWNTFAQGVDPTCVESPDLCSYLYQEYSILKKISGIIKQEDLLLPLSLNAEILNAAVLTSWSESASCFHYWDRDTHLSAGLTLHLRLVWPNSPELPIYFYKPFRLIVRVRSHDESKRRLQIFLHGSGPGGGHLIEPLTEKSFHWQQGSAQATSHRIFASLDHLEIQGLETGDVLEIQNMILTDMDITLLLPLWAGICSPEQADKLVKHTITNPDRFWKPFGLPTSAAPASAAPASPVPDLHSKVVLPFNIMIIEGLLRYGFQIEAAELFSRLMQLTIKTLSREGSFRNTYHAESGSGSGERNTLSGLVPANTFVRTLGLQIMHPQEIIVQGFNPYPRPVTVKYRGTTILCQKEKTTVIFSDGQTTTINQPGIYKVSMDRSGKASVT